MSQLREKQTRVESFIETTANVGTGFIISFLVWAYVIPLFWPELSTPTGTSLLIMVIFTVTSVARQYVWRRLFEQGFYRAVVLPLKNGLPALLTEMVERAFYA